MTYSDFLAKNFQLQFSSRFMQQRLGEKYESEKGLMEPLHVTL